MRLKHSLFIRKASSSREDSLKEISMDLNITKINLKQQPTIYSLMPWVENKERLRSSVASKLNLQMRRCHPMSSLDCLKMIKSKNLKTQHSRLTDLRSLSRILKHRKILLKLITTNSNWWCLRNISQHLNRTQLQIHQNKNCVLRVMLHQLYQWEQD